jgi:hypothetical protein
MPFRELYHGAEADKLLFNIRNGSLTANAQGQLFFAEQQWQNCLIHGADRQMGESYVAKFRVDIPDGAELARVSTSGNPDARILKIEPRAQVRAQVLELHVRRGRVGSFETETIPPGEVQAYLENKVASVRGLGNTPSPATDIAEEPPPPIVEEPPPPTPDVDLPPLRPEVVVPKPGIGATKMYLDAAKAGFKAGLKGLVSAETIVGLVATMFLAYADAQAAYDANRAIQIKFIKEGFAKGVAAGLMGWSEEEVASNAMNRVTNFRVEGLGDAAGHLKLGHILRLAELYENYAVAFGFYFSSSKSLEWKQKLREQAFDRLKRFGYYNSGRQLPSEILFEYEFLANLGWALRRTTDPMVEPMIRWHSETRERKFPTRGANAP